jgi:aryl-alcohol dehydrogenase-like predicted oxidoreductase
MQYRSLGRTGLRVSPLCLGTMNFGPATSEADSFAIMDAALEEGVNFFDTANVYGGGETEAIVGRWFAQGGDRREKVVLATKVYNGRDPWPNMSRLSARHIRDACEASLKRLQTDHIDLYQMHHVDRNTPWEEIWQAMDLLVTQGKVIYVGSSNFAGWHVSAAVEAARRRGSVGLVSEQSLYNLTARTVELEVLPACEAYGVGVLPWSPLAGGLLGGGVRNATEGRRANERVQARVGENAEALEGFEKLCSELGHEPAQVALAWLLANPVVTAPIVGPRTHEQFSRCLGALDVTLTDEVLGQLDTLFPGPGGAAPEAYAW